MIFSPLVEGHVFSIVTTFGIGPEILFVESRVFAVVGGK